MAEASVERRARIRPSDTTTAEGIARCMGHNLRCAGAFVTNVGAVIKQHHISFAELPTLCTQPRSLAFKRGMMLACDNCS